MPPSHPHGLECMEIWGTNGAAEQSASTPGVDVLVHSRPFHNAQRGGDIHYVTLCASGKLTRTILADVAGHGDAVDAVAQQLRDLLRQNINSVNQKRLVRDLNDGFARLEKSSQFATALVATIVSRKNLLTLCNAGHPRPLLYSAKLRQWRFLDPGVDTDGDLPLGIAPEIPYSQFAVHFTPGDVAFLYTDGLIEATNPAGDQLAEAGLLKLLENADPANLPALSAHIMNGLHAFSGGNPVEDDLTLLYLRHTGDLSRAHIIPRQLRAYGKLLGLVPV